MKNSNTIALHKIYKNLKNGVIYGEDLNWDYFENKQYKYPYFKACLWIQKSEFSEEKYIFWNNFGSSANKISIPDLRFIIKKIFKMNPTEFLEKYITQDQSKYYK